MHDSLTRLVLIRIFLLAFCTSLEGQTTVNLTVYATSAFSEFPLVATVYVVAGVVNGNHPLFNRHRGKVDVHSCCQASYGQDRQCIWKTRGFHVQFISLCPWLYPNGRIE